MAYAWYYFLLFRQTCPGLNECLKVCATAVCCAQGCRVSHVRASVEQM